MIRRFPNPFRVLPALALVALALSSGSARAGCGEPMLTLGHAEPAAPAKPCDGPNCAATPHDAPIPAPAPATSSAPSDCAIADFEATPLFLAPAVRAIPGSLFAIDSLPSVPFHPPRRR